MEEEQAGEGQGVYPAPAVSPPFRILKAALFGRLFFWFIFFVEFPSIFSNFKVIFISFIWIDFMGTCVYYMFIQSAAAVV